MTVSVLLVEELRHFIDKVGLIGYWGCSGKLRLSGSLVSSGRLSCWEFAKDLSHASLNSLWVHFLNHDLEKLASLLIHGIDLTQGLSVLELLVDTRTESRGLVAECISQSRCQGLVCFQILLHLLNFDLRIRDVNIFFHWFPATSWLFRVSLLEPGDRGFDDCHISDRLGVLVGGLGDPECLLLACLLVPLVG